MSWIVECFHEDRTSDKRRFVGPFDHKRDAEVYSLVNVWGRPCEGTHTFHKMNTPAVEPMSFTEVVRLIDRVQAEKPTETVESKAAKTQPFAFSPREGSIEYPLFEDIRDNFISTIKELRTRNPGLGLREAKDIVDGWRHSLNRCAHFYGSTGKICPDCKLEVRV